MNAARIRDLWDEREAAERAAAAAGRRYVHAYRRGRRGASLAVLEAAWDLAHDEERAADARFTAEMRAR